MGIRAEMYGPATTKENKKIGLEFRDITRDLVLLKSILSKAAKSVSEFSWEKVSKLKYFGTQSDRSISIHKNRSLIELESFLGKEFALYFDKITPSLQLALTKYEYGKYIDYRRGELFLPTKDQATRIVEARKYFIEELIKIKQNLIDMKNRGESFEKEDVDLAIKMTLSEWAKMARASELFGRY